MLELALRNLTISADIARRAAARCERISRDALIRTCDKAACSDMFDRTTHIRTVRLYGLYKMPVESCGDVLRPSAIVTAHATLYI